MTWHVNPIFTFTKERNVLSVSHSYKIQSQRAVSVCGIYVWPYVCVCVYFAGFSNTLKWLQMSQGSTPVGPIQQQFFDSVNALYINLP